MKLDQVLSVYDLAQELLNKNFTLLSKQRETYSSEYAFTACTCLVSYIPKKNKAIILPSTMHNQVKNEEDKKTGNYSLLQ